MFEVFKNAWRIPELRKKILYTLLMLLIFRLGAFIPVVGIDVGALGEQLAAYDALDLLDIMTGGSFAQFTIFAMGITPYITGSIIMQLLTMAIPALERISKEEGGRKKINQITRYVAIGLAFAQGVGIVYSFRYSIVLGYLSMTGWQQLFTFITIGLTLTAGTAITMWIGERINEKGIGNGISLLIFTSIVSRVFPTARSYITGVTDGTYSLWAVGLVLLGIAVVIVGIVFVDLGERRIPVQYAKRVVGRKMYGGQSTHLPMKVNSTGVLPLIFAMSIIQFPTIIMQFLPTGWFTVWYETYMGAYSIPYYVVYALLIFFFTFFYTTISFNPIEISKNLQQNGGFVTGIRPGKPTSDFLSRVSRKLTVFGALFLTVLAILPTVGMNVMGMRSAFGATSLLILVSVSLETTKQLESQMLMRHYKGFLK